jgi:hypothetical protein
MMSRGRFRYLLWPVMRLAGNVPREAVGVPRGSGSRFKLLDQRSQTFRHRFFERVVIGSEPPPNRQQPLTSVIGIEFAVVGHGTPAALGVGGEGNRGKVLRQHVCVAPDRRPGLSPTGPKVRNAERPKRGR